MSHKSRDRRTEKRSPVLRFGRRLSRSAEAHLGCHQFVIHRRGMNNHSVPTLRSFSEAAAPLFAYFVSGMV
jgi:hypothetical protein